MILIAPVALRTPRERIATKNMITQLISAAWAASLDYDYWIWADTESVLATAYGTESDFDEGNLRHAFLLDDEGQAFLCDVLRGGTPVDGAVRVGANHNPSGVRA